MRTAAVFALALIACGPDGRDDGTGGGGGGGGGSGSGSGNEDCSDAAKLIYTVDQNNQFLRFDPMTKTFTSLGTLSCPAAGATPFSMGVDRDTIAWVLYTNGKVYRVDTNSNLACTATTFTATGSLQQFGMGFSSNTPGSTDDTLFVAGGSGPLTSTSSTLATLDRATMQAHNVGTVTGWPELTGTGNAELWGWFPDETNPRIEQINKTTGGGMRTFNLPTLAGTPSAWAFAFWGGDFWIFLMKDFDLSTTVYQIDGNTGAIKGSTPAAGKTIVGAGVSTCAPTIIL
jgi:hypothetical protein